MSADVADRPARSEPDDSASRAGPDAASGLLGTTALQMRVLREMLACDEPLTVMQVADSVGCDPEMAAGALLGLRVVGLAELTDDGCYQPSVAARVLS